TGAGESHMQQGEIPRQRRVREPADQGIMEAIVGRGGAEDQVRIGFGPTLDIGIEQPVLGSSPRAWIMAQQHGRVPWFRLQDVAVLRGRCGCYCDAGESCVESASRIAGAFALARTGAG